MKGFGRLRLRNKSPPIKYPPKCRECSYQNRLFNQRWCDGCRVAWPQMSVHELQKHIEEEERTNRVLLDDNVRLRVEQRKLEAEREQRKLEAEREQREQRKLEEKRQKEIEEDKMISDAPFRNITLKAHDSIRVMSVSVNGTILCLSDIPPMMNDSDLNKLYFNMRALMAIVCELNIKIDRLDTKIDRLDTDFKRILEHIEFSVGGEEFESAKERFTKNMNEM